MTGVPLDTRIALLRQHGTFSHAYSATFQPGLAHFGDERGFIAYKKVWGTTLVLSDPLAPRANWADLIARFLTAHPDVGFWQVSRSMAEILATLGFFINEMGPDTRLDLPDYDFVGNKKQILRRALNRVAKQGHIMRECLLASLDIGEVTAVSDAWRRTRTVREREVCFLTRPMVLTDEPDVRKFFMFNSAGKILAFSGFDPIYEHGTVVGYVAQYNRHQPGAESLADQAIKSCAIKTFRAEGKKWLFLGLSPLAHIEDKDFQPHKNWLVRRLFRFGYENALFNRFIYPLQGLVAHKRQFRGVPQQTYYCFNKLPSLPRLLKVLRACDIEVPAFGVINIHTGILPEMKGPMPNIWAVIEGHERVGATVHYVDAETLDTGPVLKISRFERNADESALSLDCRLLRLGARRAIEVIAEIENGTARAVVQDQAAGHYFSYPTRDDLRRFYQRGGRLYRVRDFVRQFFAG